MKLNLLKTFYGLQFIIKFIKLLIYENLHLSTVIEGNEFLYKIMRHVTDKLVQTKLNVYLYLRLLGFD